MTTLIRVLLILALIAGLIALVQYSIDEPGAVMLTWYGYQVETTATVLVAILNVIIILAFFGGRLFGWLWDIPLRWRNRQQHRQDQRALALVALGLEAQAAGDDKALQKLSKQLQKALPPAKGSQAKEHPLAARLTAQFIPSSEQLHTLLTNPETAFIGHVGLMQDAEKREDWTATIFHATAALKQRPTSPNVRFTLLEALLHSGKYEDAQEVVQALQKTPQALPEPAFYTAAVNLAAARQQAKTDPAKALKTAQGVLKTEPLFVPAVLFLAAAQQQLGKAAVAERTLAEFFHTCPRVDIFQKWWTLVKQNNPTLAADKLTKRAESLLENIEVLDMDATKNLCRAMAMLDIGELHPAQAAAEDAFRQAPAQEILSTLADIEDRLGNTEAASGWRAEALQAPTLPQLGDELITHYHTFLEKYDMRETTLEKQNLSTKAPEALRLS